LLEGDLPAQRHHAAEGHLLMASRQIWAILLFSTLGGTSSVVRCIQNLNRH
jgi:hypothetical protein